MLKCLVGVAHLPVPALWKEISTIPTAKLEPDEKKRVGTETIVKFCSQKVLISNLLYWYTPREGLGTAKLYVGVA